MIDIKKTYKTRDGREVRIYAVDGAEDMCVHGAIRLSDGWASEVWTKHGVWLPCKESPHDLVEVKPRIEREVWLNVYPGPIVCELRHTKADADEDAMRNRIVCVKVIIDVEEGEGLD